MEDFLEREVPQCQIDFLLILISSIFFCLMFRVGRAGLIPQNFDISLMLLTSTISLGAKMFIRLGKISTGWQ